MTSLLPRLCRIPCNPCVVPSSSSRHYSHLLSPVARPLRPAPIGPIHANSLFWERDRKGGYNSTQPPPSRWQLLRDGLRELRHEFALFEQEWREKLASDALVVFRPGETDVVFNFERQEQLDRWVVTSDRDHNQGYSDARFELGPAGFGVFHGMLESRVPKDGRIKRSGYANITSQRIRVS